MRGAVAPLFDRLASEPSPFGDSGLEAMEAIQDSIGRELRRLFNTRSSLAPADYAHGAATVLEYGIPDFSAYDTQSAAELQQLSTALRLAVERYEPRLADVAIEVVASPQRHEFALVRISAQARLDTELCRVDFEMLLGTPDSLMKAV